MVVNAAAAAGAPDFSDDESSYEVDAEMGYMTRFLSNAVHLLNLCFDFVLFGVRFWALPHSIASTT